MNHLTQHALADKIASRQTELQRHYDYYQRMQSKAIAMNNEAVRLLTQANEGLAKCRQRAHEQGCENIL